VFFLLFPVQYIRIIYKDHQSLESDPAAWPAMAKRWSR
jgi:hypothetical protein